MRGTARHYDEGSGLDTYRDAEVTVERDGPFIRIDAGPEGRDQPWGRPGISLELSLDDAIDLMAQLSEVTLNAVTEVGVPVSVEITPRGQKSIDSQFTEEVNP